MPLNEAKMGLRQHGVVLLRKVFAKNALICLRQAAGRCYAALDQGRPLPERYRFNRISNSLLLTALLDFGCTGAEDLVAPLSSPQLEPLFTAGIDGAWACHMEQSWLRKKFAPHQTPFPDYHNQDWHQDGALGVRFPKQPGAPVPMTRLLTCWIPLDPCGVDSPGLEFICRPQPALLHFTELDDSTLRSRFPPDDFWAPSLEFGDCLIFLNSVLHRTRSNLAMQKSRLSIEYRIFPA